MLLFMQASNVLITMIIVVLTNNQSSLERTVKNVVQQRPVILTKETAKNPFCVLNVFVCVRACVCLLVNSVYQYLRVIIEMRLDAVITFFAILSLI
jgi:hypothetical protein